MYLLKSNHPEFQVISGPMARQRFEHGTRYLEVPDEYQHAFENVEAEEPSQAPERTDPDGSDFSTVLEETEEAEAEITESEEE